MDDVRPTTGPAARRTGSLLALALLASTALSALTPATAASTAPLVDVVVTSTGAGVAAAADAVRAAGGTVRDALPLVGGVSAELPEGAVLAPAFRVVQDYPITLASKDVAGRSREATAVREALGLAAPAGEGAGIKVAVVDTGVAASASFGARLTHHDVTGTWAEGELRDPYGHGTFVAGVLAAGGADYAGVAPGAELLDVRVADDRGETDLVSVLKGLEKAKELGAQVVNLSLASGSPLPYQLDPLTVALSNLWADGVIVVVPSGNDGPDEASVASPGIDPTLLTVAALDERLTGDRADDTVPAFSGRGPAPQEVAKPDLAAPGQSLISLRAPGSIVDTRNRSARVDAAGQSDPDGGYFRGSGTSFATAAVAGLAATLLQERAELSPDQVKAHLLTTAYQAPGLADVDAAGAGGVDAVRALAEAPAPAPDAVVEGPPTGSPTDAQVWRDFLQALMDGDRKAAANSWSLLSPEAHKWAANSWSAHKWGAHKWGANSWSAHKWAGADGTAEEWAARFWAAHKWAAHKWGSDDFVAHKWAAHKWAGEDFAAHKWAAHKWAGDDWAAHKWAAHKWAAHKWSAHDWS